MMPTESLEQSIERFTPMIYKLANKWTNEPRVPRDDLVSLGQLAVWRACEHFDPSANTKLSTYVYKAIDNEMYNFYARNACVMHAPMNRLQDEEELTFHKLQQKNMVRLNYPLKNGAAIDGEILELGHLVECSGISPEESAARHEQWEQLEEQVGQLNEIERYIVKNARTWFGHQTFYDISQNLGISRQRAQQISNKVFKKLHAKLGVHSDN